MSRRVQQGEMKMSKMKMSTVVVVGLALVAGQLGFASAAQAVEPVDLDRHVACATAAADLPAAVSDANGNPGPDTITIDGPVAPAESCDDIALTQPLVITDELTIKGQGATKTVFQRGFDDRASNESDWFVSGTSPNAVLYKPVHVEALIQVTTADTLSLDGIRLNGNGAAFIGRAIEIGSGALYISNSEIAGNNSSKICSLIAPVSSGGDEVLDPYDSVCFIPYDDKDETTDTYTYAPSTSGGAIVGGPGLISIDHSTLYGNSSSLDGGAISTSGPVEMWNNTLFSNTSLAGNGGAVSISGAPLQQSLILNNTFFENTSANGAGTALSASAASIRTIGSLFVNDTCSLDTTVGEVNSVYNVTAGSAPNPTPSASPATVPADTCGKIGAVTDPPTVNTNKDVTLASLNIEAIAINRTHPTNSSMVHTFALGEGSSAINIYQTSSLSGDFAATDATKVTDDARRVSRASADGAGPKIDAGAYEYIADPAAVTTTNGPSASGIATATIDGTVDTYSIAPTEIGFYVYDSEPLSCGVDSEAKVAATQLPTDPAFVDSTLGAVDISTDLTDLTASTTYFYCAYAKTPASADEMYGLVYSFTTDAARVAPTLDLSLKLATGNVLKGGTTTATGTGLKPGTPVYLYQYSVRKLIATAIVDGDGNAVLRFVVKGCEAAGDHKFVVTGTGANDAPVSDTVYFVLDPNCKVPASSGTKLRNAKITVAPVLFANRSYKLSAKYKKMLRDWAPLLKSAKSVTIKGYTETRQPTRAAILACQKLAKNRAKAVQSYLRSLGVKTKFVIKGYGATKPTSKKQPLNRRATIDMTMVYGR